MLLSTLLAMLFTLQALTLRRCRRWAFRGGCPPLSIACSSSTSSTPSSSSRGRDRGHQEFLSNRNWPDTAEYICSLIRNGEQLPAAIAGEVPYLPTDLKEINAIGDRFEFKSRDFRYTKAFNYAMRIGYCGLYYSGYQMQRGTGAYTVEDDIKGALSVVGYASGRTDAGVSAICQIVNFKTTNSSPNYNETIVQRMHDSDACREGKLRIYDCQRVPRKFNARSSATWRRYIYLFPLNRIEAAPHLSGGREVDVDVEAVNALLGKIEGRELPFNALAYAEDRDQGNGLKDRCTLFRARATIIDASIAASGGDPPNSNPVMCVELVGSRFLRRMVRNIVSTAVRESRLLAGGSSCGGSSSPDALLEICLSGDRDRCAEAAPGSTLILAGVGYDGRDLMKFKFMSKAAREAVERELNGGSS